MNKDNIYINITNGENIKLNKIDNILNELLNIITIGNVIKFKKIIIIKVFNNLDLKLIRDINPIVNTHKKLKIKLYLLTSDGLIIKIHKPVIDILVIGWMFLLIFLII